MTEPILSPSLMFVCLGNICRSPLAEAAFRARAGMAGLDIIVDSAGTADWHVGRPPDPRARAVALGHGVDISGYRARQVEHADFHRFTHIFALDHANLVDLKAMAPANATAELALLLDAVGGREGEAIADPYYGAAEGFEVTWADVDAAAQAIIARLMPRLD